MLFRCCVYFPMQQEGRTLGGATYVRLVARDALGQEDCQLVVCPPCHGRFSSVSFVANVRTLHLDDVVEVHVCDKHGNWTVFTSQERGGSYAYFASHGVDDLLLFMCMYKVHGRPQLVMTPTVS